MSDRTDLEVPATGLLPETHVEETQAREPTAREVAMQKIAENRQRQLEAELGQSDDHAEAPDAREQHSQTRPTNPALGEVEADRDYQDPYAVEAAPEPVEETVPGRVRPTPQPAPTSAPAPTPAGPQTFAVDIDGQQLHVTQEQLVHLARMGVVANQALHQYQTQQSQQPRREAAPPPPPDPIVDRARFAQTVKAIQYGDETTATQALEDLVTHVVARQPAAQAVDPIAIANYAANFAAQQAMLRSDTEVIRREYADLFENPIRADAAGRQLAMIRQENAALGKHQSDLELYREAGNRVRAAFGLSQSGDQSTPADAGITAPQASNIVVRRSAGEIDARKRAAPRAMSQVIDRRSAAPQAPRAPSPSDVVEMMRKSRFQTSMK
jgi:hypothetical protein